MNILQSFTNGYNLFLENIKNAYNDSLPKGLLNCAWNEIQNQVTLSSGTVIGAAFKKFCQLTTKSLEPQQIFNFPFPLSINCDWEEFGKKVEKGETSTTGQILDYCRLKTSTTSITEITKELITNVTTSANSFYNNTTTELPIDEIDLYHEENSLWEFIQNNWIPLTIIASATTIIVLANKIHEHLVSEKSDSYGLEEYDSPTNYTLCTKTLIGEEALTST